MLSHITEKYFDEEPCDINGGECFNWAYIAQQLYPQASLYTVRLFGGHAFIKLDGLFYDAEHPDGIQDWKQMKAFADNKVMDYMAEEQTPAKFKKYWKPFRSVQKA